VSIIEGTLLYTAGQSRGRHRGARNNVVVLFGTLKVQSCMLTEVRDCDLLIVVTSSTFLKRKDRLKEKSS